MDFGLTHGLGAEQHVSGTPVYMAPELFAGQPASIASDIYALGILLFYLLTGKYPVDGPNFQAIQSADASGSRLRLLDIRADLPELLARVVETAANPDPAKRYKSSGQLIAGLTEAAGLGQVILDGSESGQLPRTTVWKKWTHSLGARVSGAILIVAAVAVGAWWLRRPPSKETRAIPLIPAPLTAALGWESYPSLSSDGNQVAYAWRQERDSASHVYVKLVGEGKSVQLTSGARSDWSPVWSPDGRSIAFLRDLKPISGIYTVPRLGGPEREIAEGRFISRMAWSPDGRFLAISESQPGTDATSLSLISVENGDRLIITKPLTPKTRDRDPIFSADGRWLLFTRESGAFRCALYLLKLTTGYRASGDPSLLRQESGHISGSTWTADGTEIVYALAYDTLHNHDLMRIRVQAGAQPQRLTFVSDRAEEPAISPQGNRLVYTEDLSDADIWQVHPGEPPGSFISSTRWEDGPQYSPSGERVAFSSDRTGSRQIWVCDGDGGNPARLTHFEAGPSGTPRWSPDGRWIAFDHQENEGWRIYVMAVDGGQIRPLTDVEGDSVIPSWSGDGKWIYYGNNQTGRFELWKRPSQGGREIQLTHNGGWVAFESHDGRSLYYQKYQLGPELWVIPLGGGIEKQVLKSVRARNFAVMDDGIYYMPDIAADNTTSLRFHSFITGRDIQIAPIKNPYTGMTVSADRKTILFTMIVRTGSNVMVVDHFR